MANKMGEIKGEKAGWQN